MPGPPITVQHPGQRPVRHCPFRDIGASQHRRPGQRMGEDDPRRGHPHQPSPLAGGQVGQRPAGGGDRPADLRQIRQPAQRRDQHRPAARLRQPADPGTERLLHPANRRSGGQDQRRHRPGPLRRRQAAGQLDQTETGRVITAAATIMIFVFLTFSFLGQRDVAEFGIGLAAAVALDAFILRTVLVLGDAHLRQRQLVAAPLARPAPPAPGHRAPAGNPNPNPTRPSRRSHRSNNPFSTWIISRIPAVTILTPARPPGRAGRDHERSCCSGRSPP